MTKRKRATSSVQRMVGRHSDKRAELAAKISNDIAEGIDCGESRHQLRMAVSFWADLAAKEAVARAAAQSSLIIIAEAKKLMDVVLPPNDVRVSESARE